MHNLQPLTYPVQRLTKSHSIVSSVHLSESEERMLKRPLPRRHVFNPVTGDGKITVTIQCLPRITGEADLATHDLALKPTVNTSDEV